MNRKTEVTHSTMMIDGNRNGLNGQENSFFDKGVKRVSKWHFSKFCRLWVLIYKGLRYSDIRTTNQKVVGEGAE
jgi:hypothetical protein